MSETKRKIAMCEDCGCEKECHLLIDDEEGMGYWCAICYKENMMDGTEDWSEEEQKEYREKKEAKLKEFLAEHEEESIQSYLCHACQRWTNQSMPEREKYDPCCKKCYEESEAEEQEQK